MDNFTMVMKAKEMYEKENDFEGFLHKAYEIAGKRMLCNENKESFEAYKKLYAAINEFWEYFYDQKRKAM